MLGSGAALSSIGHSAVAQISRNRVDVFDDIFLIFLVLGTIVGVIVIAYTLYNAYKYRTDASDAEGKYDVVETDDDDVMRPKTGEVPTGAKGGKKVFLSFSISVVIVLGLIIYSYTLLLYVENPGQFDDEDTMDVNVEGFQFGWAYEYSNGFSTNDQLIVPADKAVVLNVTSRDVMHNYRINDLRAATDAIPGEYTQTWFEADEPGHYEAICFELCGGGHSNMREGVIVVPAEEFEYSEDPDEFKEWYENKLEEVSNDE
jgi:cytochrome c oxidase subunit 2